MDHEYSDQVTARFGPRLRELRTKANLTQAALAKICGVRQASVAEYERGTSVPNWSNVVRLAHALGVATDAFTVAAQPAENRNSD